MSKEQLAVKEASARYSVSVTKTQGVPTGYQRTEVGVIPEDWDIKTLGSITTLLTNGFVGKVTDFYVESDDGILYIQGYNVEENGFNLHGIKRVSKKFHAQHKKSCLQSGDLLTIQTGDIGVTAVVSDQLAGANCHALVISRLDRQSADPVFYCQYFNSEKGRAAFKEIETGSTMKHLNVGDMVRLFLPSPSLPEQRVIATALSDVDALIAALDKLIAKKRAIKTAAMQQLLTGKQRLPEFGGEWGVVRLGTYLKFQVGFPFSSEHFNQKEEGFRLVKNRDLKANDQIFFYDGPYEKAFLVNDGDVLVGMDGDFLPCLWRKGAALLNQRVGRVLPSNKIYPLFAYYSLAVPLKEIEEKTSSTTVKHLSHGDVANIECPLPIFTEQTAIATILSDMDVEITALETRRNKTQAIKQGMMQELLTGRIRLV